MLRVFEIQVASIGFLSTTEFWYYQDFFWATNSTRSRAIVWSIRPLDWGLSMSGKQAHNPHAIAGKPIRLFKRQLVILRGVTLGNLSKMSILWNNALHLSTRVPACQQAFQSKARRPTQKLQQVFILRSRKERIGNWWSQRSVPKRQHPPNLRGSRDFR